MDVVFAYVDVAYVAYVDVTYVAYEYVAHVDVAYVDVANVDIAYVDVALEIVLELPGRSCELFSVQGKNTRFVYISEDISEDISV